MPSIRISDSQWGEAVLNCRRMDVPHRVALTLQRMERLLRLNYDYSGKNLDKGSDDNDDEESDEESDEEEDEESDEESDEEASEGVSFIDVKRGARGGPVVDFHFGVEEGVKERAERDFEREVQKHEQSSKSTRKGEVVSIPSIETRMAEWLSSEWYFRDLRYMRTQAVKQWKSGASEAVRTATCMRVVPSSAGGSTGRCGLCGRSEGASRRSIDVTGPLVSETTIQSGVMGGADAAVDWFVRFDDEYQKMFESERRSSLFAKRVDRGRASCGKTCLRGAVLAHRITFDHICYLHNANLHLSLLSRRRKGLCAKRLYCATERSVTEACDALDMFKSQLCRQKHDLEDMPVVSVDQKWWSRIDECRRRRGVDCEQLESDFVSFANQRDAESFDCSVSRHDMRTGSKRKRVVLTEEELSESEAERSESEQEPIEKKHQSSSRSLRKKRDAVEKEDTLRPLVSSELAAMRVENAVASCLVEVIDVETRVRGIINKSAEKTDERDAPLAEALAKIEVVRRKLAASLSNA